MVFKKDLINVTSYKDCIIPKTTTSAISKKAVAASNLPHDVTKSLNNKGWSRCNSEYTI